ncbi:MAG: hypothetical protein DWQ10_11115 [Calditrichaeota bacterium]|nr:MAG: hypothetical protein DWQ10_11115 [Calditrichota bacterium]
MIYMFFWFFFDQAKPTAGEAKRTYDKFYLSMYLDLKINWTLERPSTHYNAEHCNELNVA